jgi:hypothetical protein
VAYETFERSSVRVEDLALTVAPAGRIFLNAASSRVLEGAGVRAVKILWDKESCRIALQAARKGDKNAYSIAHGGDSRSSTVTAKAFLHHIGWSSDRRQTVRASWDAQRKMLEAELPAQFVGWDKGSKPGSIPPTAGAMNFSSNDDPYGGNVNNRGVSERRLNNHLIHASDTERVRADIAKSKALNPDPVKTGR